MPPKTKLTKDTIIASALTLVRKQGIDALNARSLAEALSCSTQPIFSNFDSMERLKDELIQSAYRMYVAFIEKELSSGEYPAYKASGMAYVKFAKEEKELFSLLFMSRRSEDDFSWDDFTDKSIIPIIMQSLGIEREDAERFHLEMWALVHGIAVMYATDFYAPEIQLVSRMISEVYMGVSGIYAERDSKK